MSAIIHVRSKTTNGKMRIKYLSKFEIQALSRVEGLCDVLYSNRKNNLGR